jgi:Asp-tRNA(Asn)/Glu-tRNA(Gln) amidotransferase A subunit family amidase
MSLIAEWELLHGIQRESTSDTDEVASRAGVDRRHFLFFSLVAAATRTFGFGARALAGRSSRAAGRALAPQLGALPPIEDWEPLSWAFQPYPGGTGALMERLIRERGAAAFERAPFVTRSWVGPVPGDPEDLAFLPAHRLAALLRARRISSVALTRLYLARLERLNPQLNCAVTILTDRALAEAARADEEIGAGRYRGPIHGLPYGLKDIYAARGGPTTWGRREIETQVIDEDAEVAARLRDAGAVLMAKTSVGQEWFRGRTNNPWDTRRGSSGSSSGSASATAAGCVAFGIGEETTGSIVSPARECGVSALRPTFGRVSRYGMRGVTSQARVGVLCRTVEDCAMVFSVIHGADTKDTASVTTPFDFDRDMDLSSVRIGYDAGAPKPFVDGLRDLGARLAPIGARPAAPAMSTGAAESAAARDAYVQAKARELGVDLASIARRGAGGRAPDDVRARPDGAVAALTALMGDRNMRAYEFLEQQRRRHVLIRAVTELLRDLDMYVPAWDGRVFGDVGLHAHTGHPCVVVPYAFASPRPPTREETGGPVPSDATTTIYNRQPLGAVLAGNLCGDDKILSVAHRYQESTTWHLERPSI